MSDSLPIGWGKTTIGEITKQDSLFSDGDWVESKDQDVGAANRLIQLADIGDGVFINKSSRFMNDEQFERLNCTILEKDDILIARMPEPLGRACLYPLGNVKSATVVDVAVIRTPNADHYWLMSAINSSVFRFYIELNASGTTRTRIARSALSKIELLEPPLPEQKKIAAILSSVDEVIEKTQAQIDKLKDLKTGMMQELLTRGIGHTEFKDSAVGRIPVGWEVVQLRKLVMKVESGWSPQCESSPAKTGDWGVLKTTAVTWEGFNYSANKRLPDELDTRPKLQVDVGDILITRAGPADRVGVVAYVENVPRKILLSDKIIRVVVDSMCDPRFISCWLSSEFINEYFSSRTTGLAQSQTNISQEILNSAPCALPKIGEQQKIADIVFGMNSSLASSVERLDKCKQTKKALMQDLLTGKVRVKVGD